MLVKPEVITRLYHILFSLFILLRLLLWFSLPRRPNHKSVLFLNYYQLLRQSTGPSTCWQSRKPGSRPNPNSTSCRVDPRRASQGISPANADNLSDARGPVSFSEKPTVFMTKVEVEPYSSENGREPLQHRPAWSWSRLTLIKWLQNSLSRNTKCQKSKSSTVEKGIRGSTWLASWIL